jgi:hypothetical protein
LTPEFEVGETGEAFLRTFKTIAKPKLKPTEK